MRSPPTSRDYPAVAVHSVSGVLAVAYASAPSRLQERGCGLILAFQVARFRNPSGTMVHFFQRLANS